jgi:DNA (cytosine-5)-methyltransferase 1
LRFRIFILAYAQSARTRTVSTRRGAEGQGEADAYRRGNGMASDPMQHGREPRRADHSAEGQERRFADRGSIGPDVSDTMRNAHEDGANADGSQASRLLSDPASRWAGQRWREPFEAYCQGTRNLYWPDAISPVCGVANGVPSRVDRLRGLGNAVVPQVAEWIGRRIMAWETGK